MENILQEFRAYLQSRLDATPYPPATGDTPKDERDRLQAFNDQIKDFLDNAADKANTYLENDDLMVDKDELRAELLAAINEYHAHLEERYSEGHLVH